MAYAADPAMYLCQPGSSLNAGSYLVELSSVRRQCLILVVLGEDRRGELHTETCIRSDIRILFSKVSGTGDQKLS